MGGALGMGGPLWMREGNRSTCHDLEGRQLYHLPDEEEVPSTGKDNLALCLGSVSPSP